MSCWLEEEEQGGAEKKSGRHPWEVELAPMEWRTGRALGWRIFFWASMGGGAPAASMEKGRAQGKVEPAGRNGAVEEKASAPCARTGNREELLVEEEEGGAGWWRWESSAPCKYGARHLEQWQGASLAAGRARHGEAACCRDAGGRRGALLLHVGKKGRTPWEERELPAAAARRRSREGAGPWLAEGRSSCRQPCTRRESNGQGESRGALGQGPARGGRRLGRHPWEWLLPALACVKERGLLP